MATIGDRALQRLKELSPPPKHRDVADSIGMTADAFSRALSGKRQFSSIELARLADQIDADLHWLITGELDPHRVSIAARHGFNHETGQGNHPGRAGDEQTLAEIALAYRQAYSEPGQLPDWPKSPVSVRAALGNSFVRPFADRLEKDLGVEVVRVTELSTAYSLTIGGHAVIAVPATGSWFRENWDIAHELGHLTIGHHDDDLNPGVAHQHEAAANAFAAELLLPAAELKAVAWDLIGDDELAALVWEWGVSVDALSRCLCALLGYAPNNVARWAAHPTQRLELIASGAVSRATLAWMLGIDADSLDVDAPEVPHDSVRVPLSGVCRPPVR